MKISRRKLCGIWFRSIDYLFPKIKYEEKNKEEFFKMNKILMVGNVDSEERCDLDGSYCFSEGKCSKIQIETNLTKDIEDDILRKEVLYRILKEGNK